MTSHTRTIHGDSVEDSYFWLRDRSDPDTLAFLETENRRTEEAMGRLQPLQEQLYQEMLARVRETDSSVPAPLGAFEYFMRTEAGKEYPILCRRPAGQDREEEVMLDCNVLAAGTEYFALAFDRVSPDGSFLAFATNTDGDEVYTLQFKDLRTGEVLPRVIGNVYYSSAWAADSSTFFYTTLDATKRPWRLWKHRVGSESPDELVYEEPDGRFNVSIERSRSGKFLFLTVDSHTTTEVRYGDGMHGDAFTLLAPRIQDVEYYVEHQGDFLYIRTNENARNFRLMRAPAADPVRGSWAEILPNRDDVALEGMAGFRNHLALVERDRGLKRIRIMRDTDTRFVEFEEPAYTFTFDRNDVYETSKLRLIYTSLVTPRSVFDYDMDTRERELKKLYEVPGGYDPALYTSERIWAGAVPISLVYRKGVVAAQGPPYAAPKIGGTHPSSRDSAAITCACSSAAQGPPYAASKIGGTHPSSRDSAARTCACSSKDGFSPLYLYGYGAYGIITEPSFSSERISLLDRGVIFAMAHIRGSADLGRKWYDDGKLMHKKNTFTDFIACAEHLISSKYTSTKKLAIVGGSAGGLLMGAVTNMRPDLFNAVVAHVPFVDVVNTMLDPSLPLTVTEYEEWGNPNDKAFYEYMKSYAPYENVERRNYPNILATAGLNDPRVPYWEPAKWVAKLRELKTDDNLLLLKTLMGAGHGGPSGRYHKLREKAFEFAFVLDRIATS